MISCTADFNIPISDKPDVVSAHTPFSTRSGSAITNLGRITLLTSSISNICITSSASASLSRIGVLAHNWHTLVWASSSRWVGQRYSVATPQLYTIHFSRHTVHLREKISTQCPITYSYRIVWYFCSRNTILKKKTTSAFSIEYKSTLFDVMQFNRMSWLPLSFDSKYNLNN